MIDLQKVAASVLAGKKRLFPCHVNRISSLDNPCERRLYYQRAAWDQAAPVSDYLQGIFDTGKELEPVIGRIVSEMGEAADPKFRIIGSQMPTNDETLRRLKISGHIDGLLQLHTKADDKWDTVGVIDTKTCDPNTYRVLTDYNALARYPHTRAYRGQLMLYALAHNVEWCYILFVNKANLYDMRMIPFIIDMDYTEGLLKKAERINQAVDSQQPPVKINDSKLCPRCPWAAVCCPEYQTGGNLETIDNNELEGILDRLGALQEAGTEIKELEKARDAILTRGQDVICGKWMVEWQKVEGSRKPSPGGSYVQWRKKITRL
jgi:hypothetical protein